MIKLKETEIMKKKRPVKITLTYNTPSQQAIDRFTERVMLWYNEQTETTTERNEQEGKAA